MSVETTCTVRGTIPAIPFQRVASNILGGKYSLSLVLCGDALSRRINREYRKKNYPPNVLSFPFSKNKGEIFLNVRCAEREARALGIFPRQRIAHLFVHGCLHLAGLPHGGKMDASEKRILSKFELD